MKQLDEMIKHYVRQKEDFIHETGEVLNDTPDMQERSNQLEVFNTLLVYATYATANQLECELSKCFSGEYENETINYMCQQLRELNAVCMASNKGDEACQGLYKNITHLTPEIKSYIREKLSKAAIEMVLAKTPIPVEEETLVPRFN
ncbi:Uncharacterised protein [Legionella beliardensis]|uniref:Uncharacterized protein n=1 Tax=Legionella beliardensis TaxID=91822 RepID=A0A378I5E1_9GAMM|nr:hypothetical protein [Legionella beliardensis]STX27694.1 Uncharacterised protein [Legionella beliardensis]